MKAVFMPNIFSFVTEVFKLAEDEFEPVEPKDDLFKTTTLVSYLFFNSLLSPYAAIPIRNGTMISQNSLKIQ